MSEHIVHNVPAERVDFVVAIGMAEGGRLTAKEEEADGEFTLVFSFPEPAAAVKAGPAAVKLGDNATPAAPPLPEDWMKVARGEVGQTEFSEAPDNPRIVAYHSSTASGPAPDAVPWCSSFVNWCL